MLPKHKAREEEKYSRRNQVAKAYLIGHTVSSPVARPKHSLNLMTRPRRLMQVLPELYIMILIPYPSRSPFQRQWISNFNDAFVMGLR